MEGGFLATEIRRHALQNGTGFSCSQSYGANCTSNLFRNLFKMNCCNSISINVDETDNNTAANSSNNDLLQIGSLKPRYVMDDIFHREDERLKTFANWPLDWLNKNELAMTGMFYMGEQDKCKCYFCEVEIGHWERIDQPVSEHLRWSPNCPLLRRRTTNNVPICAEALDRILPAPSYDICGLNDTIEVRPNAHADMPSGSPGPSTSRSSSCSTGGTYYLEFREYAIETARLRSFIDWPRNMKQKPKELAEAGFFYTGIGDRVRCFSCGGGLKDWDEYDDPWEQHALWMSKCRYLKLMKGQNYIDSVIAIDKARENEKLQNTEDQQEFHRQDILYAPKKSELNLNLFQTGLPSETKKSPTSVPEEKLCKICYAGEYNTAFLPCGHVVACAKCASSVTKCPMCRKAFSDVMRVYFS